MPLLSDWAGEVVRSFGIAQTFEGAADVAERSAFLIDGANVIRGAWRYGSYELPDIGELVDAARALAGPGS